MAELKNELNWSYSRMRMFGACRRQYYYQYYLKWGGWDAKATPQQRTAYRLSKMKSMPLLVGEIVHGVVKQVLLRFSQNRIIMTEEHAIAAARLQWRTGLNASATGAWRDNLREICLIEDYYGCFEREDQDKANWARIETCLRSFFQSRTWQGLRRSRPERWIAHDGSDFVTATVDGVPMFGRPDMAYRAPRSDGQADLCRIFDWKTGRPREADVAQIGYYSLFAQDVWQFPFESITARLVYLYPEPVEEEQKVTIDNIDDARRVIGLSYADMKSVLSDVATNTPGAIDLFPTTTQAWRCRHCVFQEICHDRPGATKDLSVAEPDPFDYEFEE